LLGAVFSLAVMGVNLGVALLLVCLFRDVLALARRRDTGTE
jgi:hypothetical protein